MANNGIELTHDSDIERELGGVELDKSYDDSQEHVILYTPCLKEGLRDKLLERARTLVKEAADDKWYQSEHDHRRDEMHPCLVNRFEKELIEVESSLIENILAFAIQEHPDAGGRRHIIIKNNNRVIGDFTQRVFFAHALCKDKCSVDINDLIDWARNYSIPFCDNFYDVSKGVLSRKGKYVTFSEDYLAEKIEKAEEKLRDILTPKPLIIPA